MSEVLSGAEFKKQLRAGVPKLGLFVNSHSPTVAEQLAHSGYDWLLIDTQHGPMNYTTLSTMLAGVANVRPLPFVLAVGIARGARYLALGTLAVLYGDVAMELMRTKGRDIALIVVAAGLVAYSIGEFQEAGLLPGEENAP